jgi:hypothetical protein
VSQISPSSEPEALVEAPEAARVGAPARQLRRPGPGARRPVSRAQRLRELAVRSRVSLLAFLGTRVLLLGSALFNDVIRHHALVPQAANWDGVWYSLLAEHGYPAHEVLTQSTLGFFPLYPLIVRALAYPVSALSGHPIGYIFDHLSWSIQVAGLFASLAGGLATAVLVQALATDWWGRRAGARAAVLFWLFPGSVVFSMVYAESLMIPLVIGCLLALARRRWWLAGLLAALATATEPEAVILVGVCAVAAARELRARGFRDRSAATSLAAPVLALAGIGSFAVFLWMWTGTPLATLHAQRAGWGERTDGLALVHLVRTLGGEISFTHFDQPTIDLNLVVGLIGAVVLLALLVLVWRSRRTITPEAIVWTAGISFLAVTSEYVPPNPRLLITAFPAVLVLGRYLRGRAYLAVATLSGVLLALLSALTFVHVTLRP